MINWIIIRRVSNFVFFILPLSATACATVFGGILALTEDWPFEDCFWIMMGEITQLQIEMTTHEYSITKFSGKVAASFCGIWCLGFLAIIIGISGNLLIVPVINPPKVTRFTSMPSNVSPSSIATFEKIYDNL